MPSTLTRRALQALCGATVLLAPLAHAGVAVALNSADGTVSIIDTATYQVIGKEIACKEPHHLLPTPDDSSLIVACSASNQLVYFDPKTGKEQRRVRDISDPYQLGFSPDRKLFVTTSLRLDRVDVYDAQTMQLKGRLHAPKTPSHLAFDDDSRYVFVTLQDSNEVVAINLATMRPEWFLPVGATPAGILMSPDNRYLMVACMGAGHVEIIDWREQKTVKTIPAGTATHNLQPRGDGRYYFVSNRSMDGSIVLLDTRTMSIVEKYDVPGGPDDMEVRADGKELWATARFARRVQVVDLTTKQLVRSIPVGSSPHGVFFLDHAGRK
ncbi:MAG: beta-propeller fold lactonase family protein [Proteobacteria bacterium]|nr:beta-propeller fold lactonase family protein [Pseudomonadota bacterium]